MATRGFDRDGLATMDDTLCRHVRDGEAPGAVWLVARHGDVHVGAAGVRTSGEPGAVRRDTIFRISSTTKPITAAATMLLVDDGVLGLDDPVDDLLPELADRRVLRRPEGPLDDTVPARRSITVRDLLTFRMGIGGDFAATGPRPVMDALADLGLPAGPPAPAVPPPPDEWLRRLGTVPLQHQPGERWLYHTSAEVLGVLLARAAGRPFPELLAERLFEPLGMVDTAFSVPPASQPRFGSCYLTDPASGERTVYDPPAGQWSRPPDFPDGGAGLVSTVDDLLAFGAMMRAGGTYAGRTVLSPDAVAAMTSDQLGAEQRVASGPDPTGARSWGFGLAVQVASRGTWPSVGAFGWDGGLGSSWAVDPVEDLVGVLLTNQAWASPQLPPISEAFWGGAYAALAT